MKYLFPILFVLLLFSCRQSKLEQALSLSGENRKELQSVLDHYARSGEEQKLKAAEFLIENMPGHHTYGGRLMDEYIRQVDSMYPNLPCYLKSSLYTVLLENPDATKTLEREEDIEHIKADFLINHIDTKFRLWSVLPWKDDISFEDFCEYILPYRTDIEPIPTLQDIQAQQEYIDKIDFFTTTVPEKGLTIYEYKDHLLNTLMPKTNVRWFYKLPMNIGQYQIDCRSIAYYTLEQMRLLGVPAAIDLTPNWPDQGGRHLWNHVFDQQTTYSVLNENDERRPAKVYRMTYVPNRIPESSGDGFIPDLFRNPFYKDVTELYSRTVDLNVELEINKSVKPHNAYLCTFADLKWQPIAWAPISNKKAVFEHVGVGAVYIPTYYVGTKPFIAGNPILVENNGHITRLSVDSTKKETMTLTRKYPFKPSKIQDANSVVKSIFEAANRPDFSDADTIEIIQKPTYDAMYRIKHTSQKKYRFWRIRKNGNEPFIAELFFTDAKNQKITGRPICAPNLMSLASKPLTSANGSFVYIDSINNRLYKAFDNDPLTSTLCQEWIGMDFTEPVSISNIYCMPRNDGNYIYPGDEYELYFCDNGRWASLGVKRATEYRLEYQQVPGNALFWLRNLSRGREERPFTYKNGEVYFW